MVSELLTAADRERIEAAIRDAEKKSSLEFVVAVVARSADYWQWRVLLAVCTGLSAAFALLQWGPRLPGSLVILLQIPAGALAYLALGIGPLHRLLIPSPTSAKTVQAHAFRLFAEHGLHQTRDHSGLLILVSALERRVTILGDAGLHARVGSAGWQQHVEHLVARLRENRAADGIVEVIQRIDAALGRDFPARSDDIDELPNAVIQS
jgi:putative membrane protein